jgi:homoserine dehydrogenase
LESIHVYQVSKNLFRKAVHPHKNATLNYQPSQGATMPINNSPLETLAAFAIVFVAGVLSVLCMTRYIDKVRRDASGHQAP